MFGHFGAEEAGVLAQFPVEAAAVEVPAVAVRVEDGVLGGEVVRAPGRQVRVAGQMVAFVEDVLRAEVAEHDPGGGR